MNNDLSMSKIIAILAVNIFLTQLKGLICRIRFWLNLHDETVEISGKFIGKIGVKKIYKIADYIESREKLGKLIRLNINGCIFKNMTFDFNDMKGKPVRIKLAKYICK